MAQIEVEDFQITTAIEDKLWSHGLTPERVRSVLNRPWVVTRNRKARAASRILIGRDDQGQCLAIPIVPTDEPGVWRPVTAWRCKPGEAAKLPARRSIMEEPVRYVSIQEPLDDEERELMDPDNWDWEHPIEGVTVGDPGAILPIRFTFAEYQLLFDAARAQGMTSHELIKQLALAAVSAPAR
jgi:hypothetical protein